MHGFTLIKEECLNEIGAKGQVYKHVKSGVEVVFINNKDEEKHFSVAVKTPVFNDKGILHILEHCITSNYKENISFIDAYTFPDKTIYSFFSKNEKEYLKCLNICMNAVFNSQTVEKEEVFLQQAWHYEYDANDDKYYYNGIVLNEMKNKFNDYRRVLNTKIKKSMYKNSIYEFESGGIPDNICTASHSEVLDYYKTYYVPKNSCICVYGNLNIEDVLKEIDNTIVLNNNLIDYKEVKNNKLDNEEVIEVEGLGHNILSVNFLTAEIKDIEEIMALEVIKKIIFSNRNNLIGSLLDDEIGKNLYLMTNSYTDRQINSVIVENFNSGMKEEFLNKFFEMIRLIAENLTDEVVRYTINEMLFELDQNTKLDGHEYSMECFKSWMYGGSPFNYFNSGKTLKSILEKGDLSNLIEKYFLKNGEKSIITFVPKKSCIKEAYLGKVCEEEYLRQKELLKKLNTKQAESLKVESVCSIENKSLDIKSSIIDINKYKDVEILYHHSDFNEIIGIDLFFDLRNIPENLIQYLSLWTYSLQNSSYIKEVTEAALGAVKIDFFNETLIDSVEIDTYYPKFGIRIQCLEKDINKCLGIFKNIFSTLKFHDGNRIRSYISELTLGLREQLISGVVYLAYRNMSHFSQAGYYMDSTKGFGLYTFMKELESSAQKNIEDIMCKLNYITELVFNKNNLIVSVICNKEYYNKANEVLRELIDGLRQEKIEQYSYLFNLENNNEGIILNNGVNNIIKGYNFKYLNHKYSGSMLVLRSILSEYLLSELREKRGAYDIECNFTSSGFMYMYSYSDPNCLETIKVFDNFSKYLSNIKLDNEKLNSYIKETYETVQLQNPSYLNSFMDTINYISNWHTEDIKRAREEILSTSINDIRNLSSVIEGCMNKNYYCVLGKEESISNAKNKLITKIRL